MSTLTLDPVEIDRVVRDSKPSDSGLFRDVWFVGDVVIKREGYGSDINGDEMYFYDHFTGGSFVTENGDVWEVRLPQTAMVGEYIIMERVRHPSLEACWDLDTGKCNFCTMIPVDWGYTHEETCFGDSLSHSFAMYMAHEWDLHDMHTGNYMYDIYTRTIWVVDFAQ